MDTITFLDTPTRGLILSFHKDKIVLSHPADFLQTLHHAELYLQIERGQLTTIEQYHTYCKNHNIDSYDGSIATTADDDMFYLRKR